MKVDHSSPEKERRYHQQYRKDRFRVREDYKLWPVPHKQIDQRKHK